MAEQTLIVLSIILCIGLFVPELFRRYQISVLSILIIAGSILGPDGLNYISEDPIISFFGLLGSAFLMLITGLRSRTVYLKILKNGFWQIVLMNGAIPFIIGFMIMRLFSYDLLASLVVGIIFISSSLAIIYSMLKNTHYYKRNVGRLLISTAIILDMASLLGLAIILQAKEPVTRFPVLIYIGVLLSSIYVLKMFMPELIKLLMQLKIIANDRDESQLRFIIVLLFGIILYFSTLGVHNIVGAFIVGFLLSDIITSEKIIAKIHTLGYGIFVPVFFFIIGMRLNIRILLDFQYTNYLAILIVLGLIVSKILSGYFATKKYGFSEYDSWFFGIGSTAQFSTTLAVLYVSERLLDPIITSAIILTALLTTIITPLVTSMLIKKNA